MEIQALLSGDEALVLFALAEKESYVLALTRDLVARTGCGFLMVTHSARLAATLDRQVTLHAGRAR